MKNFINLLLSFLFFNFFLLSNLFAQTLVGPNSPSNVAGTFGNINHPATAAPTRPIPESSAASSGNKNWINSDRCASSNNLYATTDSVIAPAAPGTSTSKVETRLMYHKDFGFAINPALFVQGIQVDYEKATVSADIVANNPAFLRDTGFFYNPTILSGKNRTLFLCILVEDDIGNSTSITNPTIAGQTMTFVDEFTVNGTGGASGNKTDRIFIYRLTDARCGVLSGAATRVFNFTLSPLSGGSPEIIVSSAMFNNVDQTFPVLDQEDFFGNAISGSPATLQLDVPITTEQGGVTIVVGLNGNRPPGPYTGNWTNNIAYNTISTFVNGIDVFNGNSGGGVCGYTGHKFNTTSGTEQPILSFNSALGTANRMFVYALQLTRAKEYDRQVYLVKNNVYQEGSPANAIFNRALTM